MRCRPRAGPGIGWQPTVADRGSPARWWRRRSLRARITVLATALFTLTLVFAGVALLFTVGKSLLNTLDASARRTGNEVANLVETNRLPKTLVTGSGGGVSYVQVVDQNNAVIAASPNSDAAVSMLHSDELAKARNGKALNVSGNRGSTDSTSRRRSNAGSSEMLRTSCAHRLLRCDCSWRSQDVSASQQS